METKLIIWHEEAAIILLDLYHTPSATAYYTTSTSIQKKWRIWVTIFLQTKMWTKVRASARLKRPGYFSSIQVWFSTSEQDDGEATEVDLTFLQLRNGTRWCARNLFQVPEVWKRRRLLEINKRRRCCLIFFKGNSLLSIWDGRVSIKNWLKNPWSSKFSFLIILVHKYRIYILMTVQLHFLTTYGVFANALHIIGC